MKLAVIGEEEYRDKVYACWLGKNIGGTLGAPMEGRKEAMDLTFFETVPDECAPNDDLDLQLVWLRMMEERGVKPRLSDFADYWMKHLLRYPWDEYGYCLRNLQRGLRPPISGCFENDFIDQMGSPIRSEIWACIAPADPQLAARMAWKDAVLDHAGGEGVWGEMFWAAVESAAFIIDDPVTLIRIGLGMIPIWSLISRAVRSALWCYENMVPWDEARRIILTRFGHEHPCHAPQNHGFTIIGWLYGKDYGDKLCKAVNCGYDTDCTGATLGSLLGIIGGTKSIPKEWSEPVGDRIVLHKFTHGLEAPSTVGELTERTVALGKQVLAELSDVAGIGINTCFSGNVINALAENRVARALWSRDMEAATVPVDANVEVTLHYHGEPVIRPGLPKELSVTVERDEVPIPASLEIEFPAQWSSFKVDSTGTETTYKVVAERVDDTMTLPVRVKLEEKEYSTEFVILGPTSEKSWHPAGSVKSCPKCGARIEACFCTTVD